MKHPQIILVTGASSGFGRVIATQLAAYRLWLQSESSIR